MSTGKGPGGAEVASRKAMDLKHKSSVRERLAWYWGRATNMGTREIVHRLVEGAAKQYSRRLAQGWDAIQAIGPLALLPGVADRMRDCQPDLAVSIVREAEDIRVGRFHLLGACWPEPEVMPPPPAFWNVDPDDGEMFPQHDAYCFDVSFRHGVNTREIKRIWELARLQFLVPLAAYVALSGDRRDLELVAGVVRSWMGGNPPFRGPNWGSGIELALRLISVALSLSIIGVAALDEEARRAVLKFVYAHVYWLKRFPSLHSSANNHRIAELVGVIVGMTIAPGIPGAADLREKSWRHLLTEIHRQIYPDGVGAEQAPCYTAFAIELFLVATVVYEKQHDLPAATIDRLSAWAEHSLWLMDSQSRVPAIGDSDDCRVIATTQAGEPRYVASIVSAVANVVGRPDLAPPAKDPSIRDVLFGSAGALALSRQRTGLRSFPTGGYSVIRGKGEAPAVLTFDYGPVGYLSIAAHGHADTLAVWLSIGSQPIFVDAGTYRYHSTRALRNAFRETAVHNTLILGGLPSSRPAGPFNWATKARARCIALEDGPIARVIAEHDGYVARFGLRHRRTVAFDGTSRFSITDELLGVSEGREVTISLLLHPACEATFERDGTLLIAAAGRPLVRLVSTGPLMADIIRGDANSNLGWVSPSFGVRVPTDQIVFKGILDEPSTITVNLLS
jgi:Heparinase II/III-like protein/Heparinase II/III N-terminus